MMHSDWGLKSLALVLALFLAACGRPGDAPAPEEAPASPPAATDEPVSSPDAVDESVPSPDPESVATPDSLPATNFYEITTPLGRMVVRLYDETPRHRDNFKALVDRNFYDGTTFHRIIPGFMIQGGDPNSKDNDLYNDGQGGPGYTLPAEILPQFYHKRGALATARTGDQINPQRASSGSQFYIVHGTNDIDERTLDMVETQLKQAIPDPEFAFSPEVRQSYLENGGAFSLDRQYTVFGEVVEGFDTLDKIATTQTMRTSGQPVSRAIGDQPVEKMTMQVRALPNYAG